ncbi:nucleolar MIF4G domain-containing protein 1-like isoform X2 [Ipomoea triloba]|uniref:nucleolar MIF4G domain-containing protein 1-like isoform X2 n=1 Tax=Ipomoea triloba TaxID=35885 RepID=UPI00125E2FD5|nr:nucleolar MIF4G domain-containing protein 1-like isoform X2 [Ipomoea triloba]XP_031094037.1 nucleolar MIF4G domain-containing protein 1-like isoform X2 [Ipomoea triloba]
MDEDNRSRRDRRKEARLAKNKKKFDSWLQHHHKSLPVLKSKHAKIQQGIVGPKSSEAMCKDSDSEAEHNIELSPVVENTEAKTNNLKRKCDLSSNTTFNEYLEMEMTGRVNSAEDDMRLERKLAKKLRVKDGKLSGDDINMLLEGIPFVLNSVGEVQEFPKGKKSHTYTKKKLVDVDVNVVGEVVDKRVRKSDSISASCCDDYNHIEEFDGLKELDKPKKKKTKFEKYLELENDTISAEEDLALEKKLAKKLKIKGGKLNRDDDGINTLFDGIPSALELFEGEKLQGPRKVLDETLHRKSKSLKSVKQKQVIEGEQDQDQVSVKTTDKALRTSYPATSSGIEVGLGKLLSAQSAFGGNTKYIAPHLRSHMGNESQHHAQIRRRVRGLLNRLSESNVESITGDMSTIFHTVDCSLRSLIIIEEVLASCSGGPRGNEQYAAVFASFVAGMASLVGIDFSAKLLASLARNFEDEYLKEDTMSLRNLTLLFSYLYTFGVFSSDLMYDFLVILSKRLTEADVSTILAVLQSCGMKLRGDDPVGMKNFIISIQNRVNELKTLSRDAQSSLDSKRMEFMLETICDIKNNKKRPKEETMQLTRIKKWLQKLRVDDILLRGLRWSKLLDPDKRGQWWLCGDFNVNSNQNNIREVANTIDMEVVETQKMLQLAATQRMNTDVRRAIFCVIMSGEDYIDAFEKLLRLDLPGKQDREIMRVLLECCLQEKVFNKYYCALTSKLCSHDKNHKFTLQYCLWDHFKEVESMELMRSMHLSKFVAEMLASYTLSLSVLKVVDLGDVTQLTPKRIMHFRMLFEAIFEFPDKLVWNIFTRIALPEHESLCNGIVIFVREYVANGHKSLAGKFKIAKKAINNVEGVLM